MYQLDHVDANRTNRYSGEEEYWVVAREKGSREQEDEKEIRRSESSKDGPLYIHHTFTV